MSSEESKKVVLDFINCLKTQNYERLADLFAEDFQWIVPARAKALDAVKAPRDKEYSVGRMKANIDNMSKPLEFKPFGWTVDGDRVAVECEGQVVWNNGKEYNNLYHLLFEIHDGKIKKLTEYCDLMYAWETNPILQQSDK